MNEPMTDEEYTGHRGLRCPVCRETGVDADYSFETHEDTICQEVLCPHCEASWTDVYRLIGYQDLER